jgi:hypothetical protein
MGVPVVVLVTEEFEDEAHFIARAAGMPEVPMVFLPHPVAGTSRAHRAQLAARIAPVCATLLQGATP